MKSIPLLFVIALGSAACLPAFAQGEGRGGAHGGGAGHGANNAPHAPAAEAHAPTDAAPVHGRAPAAAAERSARPAAQDLSASMHDINQASFAQRKQLHETLDLRIKSSRDALKQVQSQAKDLRGDAREAFKSSLAAVKDREKELNDALKATRKSTEASWAKDRAALGQAYQNYADAVARAEAMVRAPKL